MQEKKERTTVYLDKKLKSEWDKKFGKILTVSSFTELNMKRYLYGEDSVKQQIDLLKEAINADNGIFASALHVAARLQTQKEQTLLKNEHFVTDARQWWKTHQDANNKGSQMAKAYAETLKQRIISDYSITVADLVHFAENYLVVEKND